MSIEPPMQRFIGPSYKVGRAQTQNFSGTLHQKMAPSTHKLLPTPVITTTYYNSLHNCKKQPHASVVREKHSLARQLATTAAVTHKMRHHTGVHASFKQGYAQH